MRTELLSFFYLLLCCPAAETLTHKLVILGQDVTLDCDLDVKDVYWLFLKPSGSLVMILRTFTSDFTSFIVYDERLKNKYSTQTNSRLFISNITTDELGTYYCAKPGSTTQQLGNGTRLHINETILKNKTEQIEQEQHLQTPETLTLTSLSLNVVLFITIIGLLFLMCKKPRKRRPPSVNVEEAELYEDANAVQYSEIEMPVYSRAAQPSQINGTYSLLQKPQPDARRT